MAKAEQNGSKNYSREFDASKDKVLAQMEVPFTGTFELHIALMSYNGGQPKIAVIGRGTPDAFGGSKTWPIHRMPVDVLEAVIAVWPKFKKLAAKQMMK